MPHDMLSIGVAVLAVMILGLSKGGFAGVGMVSTPLLSLVVPPPVAAGILLPILMFQDTISMIAYRKSFDRWNLKLLLPGAIAGILAGAAMVSSVDEKMFEILLGAVSLAFGVERVARHFSGPPKPHNARAAVGVICGALAGFTSMIAHAGIPPFQFFVLPQRLERDVLVATSVYFFGAVNFVKLPFFLSVGQVTVQTLQVTAALLPLAFLSVLAGIWLVRRVSTERYILLANALMIGIGVMLIMRGLGA